MDFEGTGQWVRVERIHGHGRNQGHEPFQSDGLAKRRTLVQKDWVARRCIGAQVDTSTFRSLS